MSRKTYSMSAAALVAAASLTFSSADISGAFAQDAVAADAGQQEQVSEDEIVFVAQEVVQPLEEPSVEEEALSEFTPDTLSELVEGIETDESLSDQMRCLAGAVYFESRGEPLSGQLAVAKVVINRSEDHRFPASYCGVVYQRAQFSFVKNGRMPSIKENSAAWNRAKAIAKIAHDDMWESDADDSLYFHAKYVSPRWARAKSRRAQIQSHIFYR